MLLASVGWKRGCQPFSCPWSENVTYCRKEICSTYLFKASIAAIPLANAKHQFPTRSLRSLRAAVRSTSSALCLYYACKRSHPFVEDSGFVSYAEKHRFGHGVVQVILDPCPAVRNLHKEMKSHRRTLQNLVSLKGRALSIVNESKLNHKGPLHSGQIFQLAVKSYLRLTGCDGRKWYVVTIVETAALLPQSCLHDAAEGNECSGHFR